MKKLALLVIVVLIVGCRTTTEYKEIEPFSYEYYVVDPHSDVPDAYFQTLNEAKSYKREFAANHDYVIVKMDEKYNVYNMQLDN
jgi:hypothetical protein